MHPFLTLTLLIAALCTPASADVAYDRIFAPAAASPFHSVGNDGTLLQFTIALPPRQIITLLRDNGSSPVCALVITIVGDSTTSMGDRGCNADPDKWQVIDAAGETSSGAPGADTKTIFTLYLAVMDAMLPAALSATAPQVDLGPVEDQSQRPPGYDALLATGRERQVALAHLMNRMRLTPNADGLTILRVHNGKLESADERFTLMFSAALGKEGAPDTNCRLLFVDGSLVDDRRDSQCDGFYEKTMWQGRERSTFESSIAS